LRRSGRRHDRRSAGALCHLYQALPDTTDFRGQDVTEDEQKLRGKQTSCSAQSAHCPCRRSLAPILYPVRPLGRRRERDDLFGVVAHQQQHLVRLPLVDHAEHVGEEWCPSDLNHALL